MLHDIRKVRIPKRNRPLIKRARLSAPQSRFEGIALGGAMSVLAGPNGTALRGAFTWRKAMVRGFQLTAVAVLLMISVLPVLQAFEAHVINVTGEIAQIDPPVLTPPGDIGWDNPNGGSGLEGEVEVVMTDDDPDATHIFFTYGPGLGPETVTDPACGDPNGGEIETEIIALTLTSDTVIKAIACDGVDGSAHQSVINAKIYDFGDGFALLCEPFAVSFPADLAVQAAGSGTSSVSDILVA